VSTGISLGFVNQKTENDARELGNTTSLLKPSYAIVYTCVKYVSKARDTKRLFN